MGSSRDGDVRRFWLDARADAPADAAPDAPLCDSPLTACDDTCVNIDEDTAHCGACDATCGPFEMCVAGACELDCELGSCPVLALSTGGLSSCVVQADHTVWCWGNNTEGQPGDGTNVHRPSPVQAMGVTTAIGVAVGLFHACALLADATVMCWGYNAHGELGDGTTTGRSTPTLVSGLSNVVAIGAGGRAFWGRSHAARDITTPLPFTGTGARAIMAGAFHGCLVSRDGTESCWGSNAFGELADLDPSAIAAADGPIIDGMLPIYLSQPTPRLATGAGPEATSLGTTRSCTVQAGHVSCLGIFYRDGLFADKAGLVRSYSPADEGAAIPAAVPSGLMASGVAAGLLHTCTIDGGAVSCLGNNEFRQLGTSDAVPSDVPVPVPGVTDAVAIDAGLFHSCALTAAGEVQCWGDNQFGQLGIGEFTWRPGPP